MTTPEPPQSELRAENPTPLAGDVRSAARSSDGSRVEAAAAGAHHEAAEAAAGVEPREHVTATDAPHPHLHHPEDPNTGVVRARLGRGAAVTGFVAAAVTLVGVVLFALAIGGH
jgi:hypothetical protein